jgi:hypothetical protein
MHREDNSKYLLFIEPEKSEKLETPIDDELVKLVEMALQKAEKGTSFYSKIDNKGDEYTFTHNGQERTVPSFIRGSGYKGTHVTECGERSNNCDYLLENGMITNSLAPFYLKWYRYSIPETEMIKLKKLEEFYEHRNY